MKQDALIEQVFNLLDDCEPDAGEICAALSELGYNYADDLSDDEILALRAALECAINYDDDAERLAWAVNVITNGDYTFYADVYDDEDLGRAVFDEKDGGELENHRFADYISVGYERLGADFRADTGGVFTSIGYFAPAEGAAW